MKALLLFVLIALCQIIVAQQKATIVIKGEEKLETVLPQEMMFAFPEFTDANLYMKDNTVNTTKININLFSNEILFWNSRNQVMVLSNPQDVVKITIGEIVWLPVNETFGEVFHSKGSYSLLRAKTTSTSELRKEGGYGMTSSTSSVKSVTSISTDARTTKLLPVGEYDFETETTYYISADGKNTMADARGFKKVFSTYKKDIDTFLKANKINFKTEKDIITLLDFCAGLGK